MESWCQSALFVDSTSLQARVRRLCLLRSDAMSQSERRSYTMASEIVLKGAAHHMCDDERPPLLPTSHHGGPRIFQESFKMVSDDFLIGQQISTACHSFTPEFPQVAQEPPTDHQQMSKQCHIVEPLPPRKCEQPSLWSNWAQNTAAKLGDVFDFPGFSI